MEGSWIRRLNFVKMLIFLQIDTEILINPYQNLSNFVCVCVCVCVCNWLVDSESCKTCKSSRIINLILKNRVGRHQNLS